MTRESGRGKLVAQNKKARYDYELLDTFEAGIVLTGTEVKSLRQGRCSLVDAYASIADGEAFLIGAHIPEYTEGTWNNHAPRRTRKLLMHKEEILKLVGKTKESGLALIPSRCTSRTAGPRSSSRWPRGARRTTSVRR